MGWFNRKSQATDATEANGVRNVRFPPIEYIDGEPVFRMLVLGTRGAGKTVFLASLYNQLNTKNSRNNYSIEIPSEEHRNYLIQKYEEVTSPKLEWPAGTVDVTDYEFRCIYKSKIGEIPVFRFKYQDFPGGWIAQRSSNPTFNIRTAVESAHTIVVLIDGLKVLKKLRRISDDGDSLETDFNRLADLLNGCVGRPLQFVLTKHDLLARYEMSKITQTLLKIPQLRNIIQHQAEFGLPTSLIYVSAVGKNFATFNVRTDEVKKKRGAVANPYNVDLTVSFTITDALLTRFRQERGRWHVPKWALAKLLSGGMTVVKFSAQCGVMFVDDVYTIRIMAFFDDAVSRMKERTDGIEKSISEGLAQIKDKNTAIATIAQIQSWLRQQYCSNHPECVFSHSQPEAQS